MRFIQECWSIYPTQLCDTRSIKTRGEYNPPVRIDRQDSIVVPYCHSNQTIHFNVPSHQTKPLERIQALQLQMDQCLTRKIQLLSHRELVPNRGIFPMGLDCTRKRDKYPGTRWFALKQVWDASIQFFIARDECCQEECSARVQRRMLFQIALSWCLLIFEAAQVDVVARTPKGQVRDLSATCRSNIY